MSFVQGLSSLCRFNISVFALVTWINFWFEEFFSSLVIEVFSGLWVLYFLAENALLEFSLLGQSLKDLSFIGHCCSWVLLFSLPVWQVSHPCIDLLQRSSNCRSLSNCLNFFLVHRLFLNSLPWFASNLHLDLLIAQLDQVLAYLWLLGYELWLKRAFSIFTLFTFVISSQISLFCIIIKRHKFVWFNRSLFFFSIYLVLITAFLLLVRGKTVQEASILRYVFNFLIVIASWHLGLVGLSHTLILVKA